MQTETLQDKNLKVMDRNFDLTKHKHAAAIDDSGVVVSGRRWSPCCKGAKKTTTNKHHNKILQSHDGIHSCCLERSVGIQIQ